MAKLIKNILTFEFFARYRLSLFILIISTVICNILEVFSLGAMIPFLQNLITGEGNGNTPENLGKFFEFLRWATDGKAVNLLIFFGLANLFRVFLTIFRDSFKVHLTNRVRTNAQGAIFNKYMFASYDKLVSRKNSDLIYNIISFPQDVGQLFNIIPQLTIGVIGFAVISSFLFLLSPKVFFVTLAVGALMGMLIVLTFKKRLQVRGEAVIRIQGDLVGITQQGIEGFKEIKINKLESFFDSRFYAANESFYINKILAGIYSIAPSRSIEFFVFLAVTVVGACYFEADQLSFKTYLPSVLIYIVAVFRLISPLNLLVQDIGRLNSMSYTFTLLKQILEEDLSTPKVDDYQTSKESINEIVLRDVSYSYEEDKKVLKPVNLKINKGEIIGVVGPSGAGKSTLVNLIMGLLDSQNGVISLKGNIGPINDKGRFRDYIGYVSQDSFLFRGKISENITCFNDSNKDQLEKVLYIADCEDFINKLPDGVESELGDRGLGFSGGQVQRVCIARALYKGGDILILDEATSALDPITEQKVLKSITTEYPDKIIIFLTHRLKSLDYADRVLFLEQGEVKGEGTLDSLLKENRSFERFYNRQE